MRDITVVERRSGKELNPSVVEVQYGEVVMKY